MNLHIDIIRLVSGTNATMGLLYIDNAPYCFTLEDEHREIKVPGETRIPDGEYQVSLRVNSPVAERYRKRFGSWHTGMIWLQEVPNFEWVYIHIGNTEEHTDGCPLVGMVGNLKTMTIGSSEMAYIPLAKKVISAIEGGNRVTVRIATQ